MTIKAEFKAVNSLFSLTYSEKESVEISWYVVFLQLPKISPNE